ncbi:ATP-binding protein [Thalassotalea atypica]|uniref:ATP-binding protein n=1 Tax=Thalassotalea atypica TaxID=2054316 RepID=UPI0025725F71|nr:ATP-binding protein [Thalassotalea atypica]
MKSLFFRLYLLLILTFVGLGWSIDKLYNNTPSEKQLTSDLALHRGTFFLLDAELKRHPVSNHNQHIEALSTSFGYPIALINLSELSDFEENVEVSLELNQKTFLRAGGIVTVFDDLKGESWFFRLQAGSEQVMVLGPIYTEPVVQSDVIYVLVFFIGLAFIVFIWAWPISNGLMSLTKAATAFGKGDFSVRANKQVSKPLTQLVDRFNSMADRIQRLIKSHKELSHAVSHELRTPIARMRFAMEIIRDEEDKALTHQYLDTMEENIEELDSLVDELLVYAKFDRENPELIFKQSNFIDVVNEVVAKFAQTEPHLSFAINQQSLPANGQIICMFDKESMIRIVDNLVRNAVRYTNNTIEIDVHHDKNDVVLCVNDDGEGIPNEQWQSLFEPFVRLDQSRDRKSGGIGLGLAMVKRLIELHHGHVRISRAKLGGASFILNWPVSLPNR